MSNPPAYLRREDYNFLFFVLFGKFYVLYKTTQKKKKKENNNLTAVNWEIKSKLITNIEAFINSLPTWYKILNESLSYRSRVWCVISSYSACAYVDRPSQEVKLFANRRSETNYFSSTCNTRRYKKCAWILISLNLKLKSNFTPLSFDTCKKMFR